MLRVNGSWADMYEAEMDWRVVDFMNGGGKGAGFTIAAESATAWIQNGES